MIAKRRVLRKWVLRWLAVFGLLVLVFSGVTTYLIFLNYHGPQVQAAEINGRIYRQPAGVFTCRYSGDWHVDTGLAPTEVPGVSFTDVVGDYMELMYYPSDKYFGIKPVPNRRFATAEAYFQWDKQMKMADSAVIYSALVPVSWKKQRAYEFSLSYRLRFPANEAVAIPDGEGHMRIGSPAKVIHVEEDAVVIPMVHGLFVATLSARPDLYPDYHANFRAILNSLEINDHGLSAMSGLPVAPTFPKFSNY